MEKQSITYILGAGASFQSFPIVSSFPHRFSRFTDALNIVITDGSSEHKTKENFKQILEPAKFLLNEFRTHHSFDTYFKKLFHTEEFSKIKLFKKILNIYFIWEHIANIESTPPQLSNEVFVKRSIIDKRYDALIAGLLKPIRNEKSAFCKINFISWNYDLNLLSSLKNYFFPKLNFSDFFNEVKSNSLEFKVGDDIRILNMNGYFYSSCFDKLNDITNTNIISCVNTKMSSNFLEDNCDDTDADLVRFAWELPEKDSNSIIVTAKKYIQESENVIVIGYTFPLYNRLMDIQYLNLDGLLSNDIVIQDPNVNEVKEDFITNFNLPKSDIPIIPKKGCDSFFVPEGIFKIHNGFLSSF